MDIVDRQKRIVKTSIIGILTNVLLAGFKAFVGLLSHSIAITLDAVNNLSDALSSLITIIGARLANRAPSKKHPLGSGRIEYMSAMVVAVIILYAGISSLQESVQSILHPSTPDYSYISLLIVSVGIIVKLLLGRYVKSVGIKVHSDALEASGQDALFDAIISTSTLIAAILFMTMKVSVEAYLGIVISVVIIKSGIEMLSETVSKVLGERIDSELSLAIKETVNSFDDVYGAYDLILHNYGPDLLLGSIHIEIDSDKTAEDIDLLTRQITDKVLVNHDILLTTVGIYSYNDKDIETNRLRREITQLINSYDHILQMHGFYLNKEEKLISFDIIIEFVEERLDIYHHIVEDVEKLYPEYQFKITLDQDISD